MLKKQTTIDELTVIVKKGFQGVDHKFQDVESKMVTKDMLKDSMDDFAVMVEKGFQGVDTRLDGIEKRLDRIEKIFLVDHKHRIERLEFEVKNLKDLFALK